VGRNKESPPQRRKGLKAMKVPGKGGSLRGPLSAHRTSQKKRKGGLKLPLKIFRGEPEGKGINHPKTPDGDKHRGLSRRTTKKDMEATSKEIGTFLENWV